MKFLWQPHMIKSPSFAKFQLKRLLHVSATSCFAIWTGLVGCKATPVYLGPLPLKMSRVVVLPTLDLPDIKVDPYHLPVDLCILQQFAAANFS